MSNLIFIIAIMTFCGVAATIIMACFKYPIGFPILASFFALFLIWAFYFEGLK